MFGRVIMVIFIYTRDRVVGAAPYHSTIGDQPHQRMRGQQAQAHDQGVLESLQRILLLACIHNEQKDRGCLGGTGELILDC